MGSGRGTPKRMAEVSEFLKGRGRILVRASGTEPLIRVMVESSDRDEAKKLAEEVAVIIPTR